MLSVIIPTRNDERALVPTLASLVTAAADGVVRDVTIADAGSTDATVEIADLAGCVVVTGGARGERLDRAARGAKGPWLLVLVAGVTLEDGWHREVASLIEALERRGEADRRIAAFRYGVDGFGARARLAERLVGLSRLLTGLPRPKQGLLIHSRLYDRAGGFRALPAMAGADLIRRVGTGKLIRLRARALAPSSLLDQIGRTGPRAALGAGLLMLRVPPRLVSRLYG